MASADGPIFVRADRQLLGQAIANLLDNAIKYGAPAEGATGSGTKPEIGIAARAGGNMAEIVVTDHGPGVPAQERERVLGRFVRLEASRSEPGSGLGLSLVAAVASLHGGTLKLEDNKPGLRVVLTLPRERNALINGTAAETEPRAETPHA
jgi:signal transduction histidine kinase